MPSIIRYLDELRKNDLHGGPSLGRYSDIGIFAPTTLRYIKFATDMNVLFGDLHNMRIAEIGGGYGGQCRILSALFKIKSYDIFDLEEPLMLTKRYLDQFKLDNINYCNIDSGDFGPYDLVISTYAISEIKKSIQEKYIKKVLKKSMRGYVIYNQEFFSKDYPEFTYSADEFINMVTGSKKEPTWTDTCPTNSLIFW